MTSGGTHVGNQTKCQNLCGPFSVTCHRKVRVLGPEVCRLYEGRLSGLFIVTRDRWMTASAYVTLVLKFANII